MVRLQRRPRPQIPPPRPILEVHWCQSGRKRAQPKAVSVMIKFEKAKQRMADPLSGKIVRELDAAQKTKSQRVGNPERSNLVKLRQPARRKATSPVSTLV